GRSPAATAPRRDKANRTPRPAPRSPARRAGSECAPASPGRTTARAGRTLSAGRSQPSLDPFRRHEEQEAHQNDQADRRIGAGEIVTLGKIVDQLAESAEIDQELDADHVDQRENQPEAHADKDRGQGGWKQDLPELLRRRELEAFADVDQHTARAGESFDGLE